MVMDAPSLQLQETLNGSIQKALLSRRPILTHLNADTSWLLQLPYPPDAERPPGRSRWNIVFDPWLTGGQSDVAYWFSQQWHAIASSVQTMAELNDLLRELESMAQLGASVLGSENQDYFDQDPKRSYIDAVVVSHEFTDHCNKDTLLELNSDTPVFATKFAADLIRSWNHFSLVQETPPFSATDSDWRNTSLNPLPKWLGISRMVTLSDALYYHSAILVTFDLCSIDAKGPAEILRTAEAIIYTPHGIHAKDLSHLLSATPAVKTLALLHGLHDIKVSVKQLNLGAHNGLQAQRMCQAKYWVSTHDEIKKGSGLITPFLYRRVLTLQEAIEEERRATGRISDESELSDVREVAFEELRSGESLLLV
ncbi:hypothetical protein IMSHALPRED_004500 [Imshaugia aleurites]|uniref:Uncharacterized protein n=1 Tax=Imshaugia aleurites TaxID=172621 RepID=A0A8H3F6F5_9LECA|nr:hypothetical protein IMSHALPRED_004500 [Imshaugia aleurites]